MIMNSAQTESYVIIVSKKGEKKFIDKRHYSIKGTLNCTIKPNRAKRFSSEKTAKEFWNDWKGHDKGVKLESISKLIINYSIEDINNIENNKEYCYIIAVSEFGKEKYIHEEHYLLYNDHSKCTTIKEEARKYRKKESAQKFWNDWEGYNEKKVTFIRIEEIETKDYYKYYD